MKSRRLSALLRPMGMALLMAVLIVSMCLMGCELSSISKDNSPTPPPADNETDGKTDLNNNDVQNNGGTTPPPVIEPEVVYYNALTGLKTTSELAALRPVAICMENKPYSLPQYGLSGAQMLIEVPTADGSTKLMMLTTDYRYMTTIGALASTRPYMAELSNAFDAIHCFNGTDGTITDEVLASYDCLNAENALLNGVFYKDETRFDKDDIMTNGILIDSGIRRAELDGAKKDIATPYIFCSPDKVVSPGGERANQVMIRYSDDYNTVFRYDEKTSTYLRSQFGSPTLDGTNNEQIGFQNVLIMYASSSTYESQDNKTLDFVMADGGTGVYVSNGTSVTFQWNTDENGSLMFTDMQGATLEINRGTTYIGLVPVGQQSHVTIQ